MKLLPGGVCPTCGRKDARLSRMRDTLCFGFHLPPAVPNHANVFRMAALVLNSKDPCNAVKRLSLDLQGLI